MLFVFLLGLISAVQGLDNGLALTPPMGWSTWKAFGCVTDCTKDPNGCISESLMKRTADMMVSQGYLGAGYNYLILDACWSESANPLVPDKERFPNGMKAVADYIHSKDLKFGLTLSLELKLNSSVISTLASWEIDYLKLGGGLHIEDLDKKFIEIGKLLNETGRPILYSCSWPYYTEVLGKKLRPNYDTVAKHCNTWRNWYGVYNSTNSLMDVINWFGDNQGRIAKYAGPGQWNDPDMLVIGKSWMTEDVARLQMAVWAVLAAPLIISADLATIKPQFQEILINKNIIDVNQDPLAKQGIRVFKMTENNATLEVWKRELNNHSLALAFVSLAGTPTMVNFTRQDVGMPVENSFIVADLYREEADRLWEPNAPLSVQVNATGVKFYKMYPIKLDKVCEGGCF